MKTNSTKDIRFESFNYFSFNSGLNLELISIEEKTQLERHAKVLQVKKKTPLFCEGETPRGLYILRKGKVKFSRLNPDGSEQIYFIYSTGDMFGFRPILNGTRHTHSVTAIEECEYLFIEKETFMEIIKTSKHLYSLFLDSICKDFTLLTNMINVFTRKSIRERTAYFLLILNEKYKIPGQLFESAEIKVSRADLASYIGSSIENLIRTIKDFKDKNYIRVDGKSIYINDFDALYSTMNFQTLN